MFRLIDKDIPELFLGSAISVTDKKIQVSAIMEYSEITIQVPKTYTPKLLKLVNLISIEGKYYLSNIDEYIDALYTIRQLTPDQSIDANVSTYPSRSSLNDRCKILYGVTYEEYDKAFAKFTTPFLNNDNDIIKTSESKEVIMSEGALSFDIGISAPMDFLKNYIKNYGKIKENRAPVLLGHCLTGDTKIKLLDGTDRTLEDLADLEPDTEFWVYASKEDGEVIPTPAFYSRITKYVTEIAIVTLDNGEVIKCTPDHPFMLRDGSYREVKDITLTDSLMPLYYSSMDLNRTWQPTYPTIINNKTGRSVLVHRLVVDKVLGGYKKNKNICHHIDCNKQNNDPYNLALMQKAQHDELHTIKWSDPEYRSKRSKIASENGIKGMQKLWYSLECEETRRLLKEKMGINLSKRNTENWKDPNYRIKKSKDVSDQWAKEGSTIREARIKNASQISHGRNITCWKDPEYRETMTKVCSKAGSSSYKSRIIRFAKSLNEITEDCYEKTREQLIKSGSSPTNYLIPKYERVIELFGDLENLKQRVATFNHKIVSVEIITLPEAIPVYDITVPDYHNFALNAGVFVHNSGVSKSSIVQSIADELSASDEWGYRVVSIKSGTLDRSDFLGFVSIVQKMVGDKVLELAEDSPMEPLLTATDDFVKACRDSIKEVDVKTLAGKELRAYNKIRQWCRTPILFLDEFNRNQCLVGDTRIKLLDGTSPTIKELHENYKDKQIWLYACDEEGNIHPATANLLGITGTNAKLVKVTLDNGEVIKCTPEHRFMLRDGSYKEAQYLNTDESLMPIYEKLIKGYKCILHNSKQKYELVHRIVAKEVLGGYQGKEVCHHRDFNKLNNKPPNLEVMSWGKHGTMHGELIKRVHKLYPDLASRAGKRAHELHPELATRNAKKRAESGELQRTCSKGGTRAHQLHPGLAARNAKQAQINNPGLASRNGKKIQAENPGLAYRSMLTPEGMKLAHKNSAYTRRNSKEFSKLRSDITKRMRIDGVFDHVDFEAASALCVLKRSINIAKKIVIAGHDLTEENYEKYRKDFRGVKTQGGNIALSSTRIKERVGNFDKFIELVNTNHKVVSVEFIEEREDVYDIEVPGYNNFALDSGIFVHNSRAIQSTLLVLISEKTLAGKYRWFHAPIVAAANWPIDISDEALKDMYSGVDTSSDDPAPIDRFYKLVVSHLDQSVIDASKNYLIKTYTPTFSDSKILLESAAKQGILFDPNLIDTKEDSPSYKKFPSFRSWEFILMYLSAKVKAKDLRIFIPFIRGLIGEAATNTFLVIIENCKTKFQLLEVFADEDVQETLLKESALAGVPSLLLGRFGIGKTAKVSKVANDSGSCLLRVDLSTLDRTTSRGTPVRANLVTTALGVELSDTQLGENLSAIAQANPLVPSQTTKFVPFDLMMKINDAKSKGRKIIILYDEINRCDSVLMSSVYDTISEQKIQGVDLCELLAPDAKTRAEAVAIVNSIVTVVAAGNITGDVESLDVATLARFTVNNKPIIDESDYDSFLRYANKNFSQSLVNILARDKKTIISKINNPIPDEIDITSVLMSYRTFESLDSTMKRFGDGFLLAFNRSKVYSDMSEVLEIIDSTSWLGWKYADDTKVEYKSRKMSISEFIADIKNDIAAKKSVNENDVVDTIVSFDGTLYNQYWRYGVKSAIDIRDMDLDKIVGDMEVNVFTTKSNTSSELSVEEITTDLMTTVFSGGGGITNDIIPELCERLIFSLEIGAKVKPLVFTKIEKKINDIAKELSQYKINMDMGKIQIELSNNPKINYDKVIEFPKEIPLFDSLAMGMFSTKLPPDDSYTAVNNLTFNNNTGNYYLPQGRRSIPKDIEDKLTSIGAMCLIPTSPNKLFRISIEGKKLLIIEWDTTNYGRIIRDSARQVVDTDVLTGPAELTLKIDKDTSIKIDVLFFSTYATPKTKNSTTADYIKVLTVVSDALKTSTPEAALDLFANPDIKDPMVSIAAAATLPDTLMISGKLLAISTSLNTILKRAIS